MTDQQADITWNAQGVPVSRRFDDPYYSLQDGLAETRHTFLAGNDLPARFGDGFHVAELGFGTGLNLLATIQSWRTSGQSGRLRYTTFEAFPMQAPQMTEALKAFPELAPLVAELRPDLGQGEIETDTLSFRMITGDARQTLPAWRETADAWFLDGFAPAKNPELWGAELMQQVFTHTAHGGTAATYTAAGHVRRALAEAGFDVTRAPGYGRKRHMTRARRP